MTTRIHSTTTDLFPAVKEYTEVDVVAGDGDELDAMLTRLSYRQCLGSAWLGHGLHIEYRGTFGGGYTLGLWPISTAEAELVASH